MKKHLFLALFVALMLSTNISVAQVSSWELDKPHSNFYFSVDHIFSKVNGLFLDYTGTVDFSPDNLAESKFIFEIKINSITTHNAKRDKHLLSADFFNESEFPTMRFESKTITLEGENLYKIDGIFTVKGKEYPLTLPLTLAGIKEHPMMKGTRVAGFNGKITIDRLTHGVGNGKFFEYGVVGKDVEIFVSLEVLSKS